mmetsp:Transcript_34236/g.68171  ORF Transcript_34236/g.68171 Transcript_34236/m.68171 type:complete len:246 (-) Transcript_34236:451-1188(-)
MRPCAVLSKSNILGSEAIAVRVTRLAPPKPTTMIFVPAFLATVAASMASLSLPPIVCTPSDMRIITLGASARSPVPVKTDCPRVMPPDIKVSAPIGGALSMAAMILVSEGVRSEWVTMVVSNSTKPNCAAVVPIVKASTTVRASCSTTGRCAPTLPELSTTRTMSSFAEQGGGCVGGEGGEGGGLGGDNTGMPQTWIASICSKPNVAVVMRTVSPTRGVRMFVASRKEPHDVVSVPSQKVFKVVS